MITEINVHFELNLYYELFQLVDFYKLLKTKFCLEEYLLIQNCKHRNALTRLRISAHNLFVERGRYTNPPTERAQRTCLYCLSQLASHVVEDELHVICDCPLYHKIRKYIIHNNDPLHKDPTWESAYSKMFSGTSLSEYSNSAELAHLILEAHGVFNKLYTTSQHLHASTGSCIIL